MATGREHMHTYTAHTRWSGSTGVGYDDYDREHEAAAEPSNHQLALSSDPAFRGDPTRLNPEQLILLAASSCQLLSFLAVAARARIDVVAYEDEAHAEMPEDDPPIRITKITLRTHITIRAHTERPMPPDARLRRLVDLAHRECYVANSLRTDIQVEPTFTIESP